MRYVYASIVILFAFAVAANAQNSRAETASSYLERGNQWLKKGQVERAIADFDLAIASDPGSEAAFYNRGLARYIKGDYDNALADFVRVLQLNPRLIEAWCNLII